MEKSINESISFSTFAWYFLEILCWTQFLIEWMNDFPFPIDKTWSSREDLNPHFYYESSPYWKFVGWSVCAALNHCHIIVVIIFHCFFKSIEGSLYRWEKIVESISSIKHIIIIKTRKVSLAFFCLCNSNTCLFVENHRWRKFIDRKSLFRFHKLVHMTKDENMWLIIRT